MEFSSIQEILCVEVFARVGFNRAAIQSGLCVVCWTGKYSMCVRVLRYASLLAFSDRLFCDVDGDNSRKH